MTKIIKTVVTSKSVKDIIKDVLYSKEGATSYHQGNPFAHAFNRAING